MIETDKTFSRKEVVGGECSAFPTAKEFILFICVTAYANHVTNHVQLQYLRHSAIHEHKAGLTRAAHRDLPLRKGKSTLECNACHTFIHCCHHFSLFI